MFEILPLQSDTDNQLQASQGQYEIDRVENLGKDVNFIQYVVIEYSTQPGPPVTGSIDPSDNEGAAKKKAK